MISLFINLGMKKFSVRRLNFKNSQCLKSYFKIFCNSKTNSVGLIDIAFKKTFFAILLYLNGKLTHLHLKEITCMTPEQSC